MVDREMNITTRFSVFDLLHNLSLNANIPLFTNNCIFIDRTVSPEPRGFRENGWRHDDRKGRISKNP